MSQFSLIGKKLDMLGTFFVYNFIFALLYKFHYYLEFLRDTYNRNYYIENKKLDQTRLVSCERKMGLNFDSNS